MKFYGYLWDDTIYNVGRSNHRGCSIKKLFLKISQNSQENTCVGVSFLTMLHALVCNFTEKEMLPQLFSCEFCEILSTPSLQNTSRQLFLFCSLFLGLSSFYPFHISLFYQGFLSTALMRSLPRVFSRSASNYQTIHCIKSVRIGSYSGLYFSHSDWIRRDTSYLSVFSPNAGKYRPE